MPKSTGDNWKGAPATAEYLGVTLRLVYGRIDDGSLPAYKVGRVIRIRTADIESFLEAHRIAPGELRHLYDFTGAETDDGAASTTGPE